ncbi:MAG: glycine--tRNA ligase subunit beta, partial [Candidatus Desulfofervidus auxilii]|nr:glycine--tRNA ligase subunit beta [Candidatus Desulfofervidus auxilii]
MKTLVLEIGTEELPLTIFPEILDQMETLFSEYLQQANLTWSKIKIMATPRRLTVMVTGLPEKQTGEEIEVIGPPYKIAFDHDGNPTKAAIGFAQKQGVSVSELTCIETPKGEYVGVKIKESDQPTEEILAKLLPDYILSLSFPKSMRWHEGKIRFTRPIHWILALLDNKIISFTIDGIKSNNITFGHRFSAPEAITISHPDQYISKLKNAFVIVEPEKRRDEIINLANKAAQGIGGRPLLDKELLNWVNFLVEYPVAIAGKFDDAFLELPSPVLITVMKHHQKYLPIQNEKQRLLPGFVAIINTPVVNIKPVQKGLERVL